jgi:glutathione synthase/RimK-type ligase-like ATP-grasp enzyme
VSQTLIVIHSKRDWEPYYPSDQVISFADYVTGDYPQSTTRFRVINLCRKFNYLSEGYYCSLLAEARGDKVIPSVRTVNDLSSRSLYRINVDDIDDILFEALGKLGEDQDIKLMSYFGHASNPLFDKLARKLFETFPCPILEISLRHRKRWEVVKLKLLSPRALDDEQEYSFAEALDSFSRKVWRAQRKKQATRYDLAILCEPGEDMPPSDTRALKRFIRAGRQLGLDCELITQRDYLRLAEYDGLFIRTTTNINHYTYRFAKKAENEGLAVIDDSTSILRCTNKVYLADLFRKFKVPSPRTVILHRNRSKQLAELETALGYPMVIKIPDGAFSRGVEKATDRAELESICGRLFKHSTLLLAQEYLYTDFDWRIGILDNAPIYACRYYMVKHHWQIYRHGGRTKSGGFDAVPVSDVPIAVIDAALQATKHVGDGFYGVDVKEKDGRGFVIEVNDNPSIDCGIEDKYLGMELYRTIMGSLLRRMEARRGNDSTQAPIATTGAAGARK